MWPDHCIQGTIGAEFHKNLKINFSATIPILKGTNTL
jgi:nicotinamidase-related amidase